jgi:hypothetical protein
MALTAVVDRPATATTTAAVRRKRRRRFRFSLNGLAIQLSAFAVSSTLVALLVVTGSQAAFVEPNETLAEYVPIGTPTPTDDGPRRPGGRQPAAPAVPTPEPTAEPTPVPSPSETPTPTPQPTVPDVPVTKIALTDSAAGTALFGNETLSPGVTVERCIAVTYAGNADPEPVRLFAAATSGDLAPYLDLTIHIGRDGTAASGTCAGFSPSGTLFTGTLAGFAATHASAATGRSAWDPSESDATRTFRFSLAVQDVPPAAGKSASFGFSWRTEAT